MYRFREEYANAVLPVFSMTKSIDVPDREYSLEREPSATGCRSIIRNKTRSRIIVRWSNGVEVIVEPEVRDTGWYPGEKEEITVALELTARPKDFSRKFLNLAKHPVDLKLDEALQKTHNLYRYGESFSGIPSFEKKPLEEEGLIPECNLNYKINIDIVFSEHHPNECIVSNFLGATIFTSIHHKDLKKTSSDKLQYGRDLMTEELFEETDAGDSVSSEQLLLTNAYIIDRGNRLPDYFTWLHGDYCKLPRRNSMIGEDGVYVQVITGRNSEQNRKRHFTVEECASKPDLLNRLGIYAERNDVFEQKNSKHIQELKSRIQELEKEAEKRNVEINKLNEALSESKRREESIKEEAKHTKRMHDIEIVSLNSKHAGLNAIANFKILEMKGEINSLQQALKYIKEDAKSSKFGDNVKNGTMLFSLLVNVYRFLI